MNRLTYTQEYMLVALTEGGNFPAMKQVECDACLVVAGVVELMQAGVVYSDDKNRLVLAPGRHNTARHLQPLVDVLAEKQPMKIYTLAEKYLFTTSARIGALYNAVGGSLADKGIVTESRQMFTKKKRYVTTGTGAADEVVRQLREGLLQPGDMSDDAAVMAALLNKSGLLKRYFSKHESQIVKQRIKEIKKSPTARMATELIDYVVIVIAAVSH